MLKSISDWRTCKKSEMFDIHRRHSSVKTRDKNMWSWHYCNDVYPKYFGPMRETATSIFEVGVLAGASLRAMKEYFPNAKIVGLDVQILGPAKNEDRIEIIEGSQNDKDMLNSIGQKYGPFDLIIDDGSHLSSDQVITLDTMLPYLKKNGWYFVEDVVPILDGQHIFKYVIEKFVGFESMMNPESALYSLVIYPGLIGLQRNL